MQATSVSGQPPLGLDDLLARLAADHRLEIAHHRRIGVRAGDRADHVERVVDMRDPVAQRVVHRVLQGRGAGMHRHDLGAEQFHPEDIRLLPLDVGRAHVDDARYVEQRAGGGGRDPVLAGAGLGDDAAPAHAAREQDLAEHVIDLVRAGVVELVAFEIELGAAEMPGQPLGEIKRARPADIVVEVISELGVEIRIVLGFVIGAFDRQDQRHQRLGDVTAAIETEMAALVRAGAIGVRRLHRHSGKMHHRDTESTEEFFSFPRGCRGETSGLWSLWVNQSEWAILRNSRIFSGSLSPGVRSTPEDTSTAGAPETRPPPATVLRSVRPTASKAGAICDRRSAANRRQARCRRARHRPGAAAWRRTAGCRRLPRRARRRARLPARRSRSPS